MKSSSKCRTLLTLACLSVGASAHAQSSTYGSPSLLPFPQAPAANTYGSAAPVPLPSTNYFNASANYGGPILTGSTDPLLTPEPVTASPSDQPGGYGANLPSGQSFGTLGANPSSSLLSNSAPGAAGGCDAGGGGMSPNAAFGMNGGGLGCGTPGVAAGAAWFGSVGGLVMTRNHPNPFWTTYNTSNNELQVMNTKEATNNWGGGGQVTLGRWWCCGNGGGFGIQFTYWQIFGLGGYTNVTSATNQLGTTINENTQTGTVMITSGHGTTPSTTYFDGSPEQRIWRTDNVSNFELNILKANFCCTPCNPQRCNLTFLGGFRYFRFQESLTYGSVAAGNSFGSTDGYAECYLRSNCTNNLFGFQIGTLANFMITPRWGAYALPKVGVFGNSVNITNTLYTGDGYVNMDQHAHKNCVSLLGEIDVGTYYWLSPRCQVYGGWRVVGVSQVALGDNQFLPYLADTAGYATAKTNGDLILTGAFAGLAFTF